MVLSSKLNLVPISKQLHTFHFKFKRPFDLTKQFNKSPFAKQLIKDKQHFLILSTSKNLFNIGQFNCRMSSTTNPIVIEPKSTHKSTLIFFHGLGDTGNGWSDYWRCLNLSGLKVVLPTAPSIKVTLNMGLKMPSWFDIYGLAEDSKEDEEGIKKASQFVHNLIEEEISKTGLSSEKILLGGFSMGAALAIYSALTYPKKLAGVVLYSGWLPLHKSFTDKTVTENRDIKILQCHGDSDFVVPLRWGKMTKDHITNELKNENIDFKVYEGMGHEGSVNESKDTKIYLTELLSKL